MSKGVVYVLGIAGIAMAAAAGLFLLAENDPAYRLGELAGLGRYGSHDALIASAAARHGVDPLLVKAVVWQESRFQPDKLGAHGERGLMQITEPAAEDWVQSAGVETFVPEDLLDAKTNLEVGTWYLAQALKHWSSQEDPLPFALGEYNAGRSRVKRWSRGAQITAEELGKAMDIPSTRAYVASVRDRYEYYKGRGGRLPLP
ncbi:MAG: lytic transglycosylase domain-containing protein [Chthoniobacterales bacterium]|nr:lytic transglycosylase domain-containing protein [Chthoniobacterales bacterium]